MSACMCMNAYVYIKKDIYTYTNTHIQAHVNMSFWRAYECICVCMHQFRSVPYFCTSASSLQLLAIFFIFLLYKFFALGLFAASNHKCYFSCTSHDCSRTLQLIPLIFTCAQFMLRCSCSITMQSLRNILA